MGHSPHRRKPSPAPTQHRSSYFFLSPNPRSQTEKSYLISGYRGNLIHHWLQCPERKQSQYHVEANLQGMFLLPPEVQAHGCRSSSRRQGSVRWLLRGRGHEPWEAAEILGPSSGRRRGQHGRRARHYRFSPWLQALVHLPITQGPQPRCLLPLPLSRP